MEEEKKKRFELRNGRWGAYFYDNKLMIEVDLNNVLFLLNEYYNILKSLEN